MVSKFHGHDVGITVIKKQQEMKTTQSKEKVLKVNQPALFIKAKSINYLLRLALTLKLSLGAVSYFITSPY